MTPQAPWTKNCIRKAPIVSRTTLFEKAQSGMTGSVRSAAMTIARRRPICSEYAPKNKSSKNCAEIVNDRDGAYDLEGEIFAAPAGKSDRYPAFRG